MEKTEAVKQSATSETMKYSKAPSQVLLRAKNFYTRVERCLWCCCCCFGFALLHSSKRDPNCLRFVWKCTSTAFRVRKTSTASKAEARGSLKRVEQLDIGSWIADCSLVPASTSFALRLMWCSIARQKLDSVELQGNQTQILMTQFDCFNVLITRERKTSNSSIKKLERILLNKNAKITRLRFVYLWNCWAGFALLCLFGLIQVGDCCMNEWSSSRGKTFITWQETRIVLLLIIKSNSTQEPAAIALLHLVDYLRREVVTGKSVAGTTENRSARRLSKKTQSQLLTSLQSQPNSRKGWS